MQRRATGHRGFILITVLALTLSALTLSAVGFTRSMVEVSGAYRYAATQQAFSVAEAGMDDTLVQLPMLTSSQVNDLLCLSQPTCASQKSLVNPLLAPAALYGLHAPAALYTVQVLDNVEDPALEMPQDFTKDADRIVSIRVTGQGPYNLSSTISATVQLPGSASSVFDYGILAGGLMMRWPSLTIPTAATLGKDSDLSGPMNQVPMLLTGGLSTASGNQIWADSIKFTSVASCNQCNPADLSVFKSGTPVQEHQPFLSSALTTLDLNPYYAEAIAECVAEGKPQATCVNGSANSVHHITSNTVWTNQTVTGVVYVEKGVDLVLLGTTTVNGTIAHEGYDDKTGRGILNLSYGTPAGVLTIDSTAGAKPFAPGLAIVGGALVYGNRGSPTHITGAVFMGGRDSPFGTGFAAPPHMTGGPTTIDGGVYASNNFARQLPSGINGPGVSGPINWGMPDDTFKGLHSFYLIGDVKFLYHKPSTVPPGFPSAPKTAKILAWQTQ